MLENEALTMHEEEGKAPLSKEEGGGSVALQSERKEKEKKGKGNWRTAYSPLFPLALTAGTSSHTVLLLALSVIVAGMEE